MSSEAAVLGVTLNRDRLNGVSAPESFTAGGAFAVALHNEGEPVHVHLRFDGSLAEVASVAPPNHYVDGGSTRRIRVGVAPVDAAVDGTLEIIVGHGAEATTVPLRVDPSVNAHGADSTGTDSADTASPDTGSNGLDSDAVESAKRESEAAAPVDAAGIDSPDADSAGVDSAPTSLSRNGGAGAPTLEPSPTPGRATGDESASTPALRRLLAGVAARVRAVAHAPGDSGDRERAVPSPEPGSVAVGVLAAAALVGAGIVAATLDGLAVTLGVVAVCVAVLVAGFLLLESA